MWRKGLPKWFVVYMGNEMLLVSDCKMAYQLASFLFSLPAYRGLQAALWEKYLSFIVIIFILLMYSQQNKFFHL